MTRWLSMASERPLAQPASNPGSAQLTGTACPETSVYIKAVGQGHTTRTYRADGQDVPRSPTDVRQMSVADGGSERFSSVPISLAIRGQRATPSRRHPAPRKQ